MWQVIFTTFLLTGFAAAAGASCSNNAEVYSVPSITNFDASNLGYPRNTVLVTLSEMPRIGELTTFEHEYLQTIARAAQSMQKDVARIVVAVLPYASFDPSAYSEASMRYREPVSVLEDAGGQSSLIVNISPARLLALASGGEIPCDAPLVLDAGALNSLAGTWATDVLPHVRNRAINKFASDLPPHLAYLPALLKNAGGGGPFPFTETVNSYTEQCLSNSLPYLEAFLTRAFSGQTTPESLSDMIATPPSELIALQPDCLNI